ncbi:MAG: ABC transporter permease [Lentimicrobiaceae bacterium]|nr:ABC transporter permease [Lentimicrobiaceae bacterium]MBQ4549390.1 ABC transporter permease [Bacteroidales bacterium]
MNNLGIIIKREYLTRVKKRSFLLLTFLGPLFFAALMIAPSLLMLRSEKMESKKAIVVLDESGMFEGKIENTDANTFIYENENANIDSLKKFVFDGIYDAFLYIPSTSLNIPVNAKLYSDKQIPMTLSSHIEREMKQVVEHQKLLASGIDPDIVKASKTSINVSTIRMDEESGEKTSYAELEYIIGLVLALVIYFAIFLFSNQVLRGVIEEKTNRIIEVIISSVKPFELMMGKIVGIALVGLTQFLLWIVLTIGIYLVASGILIGPEVMSPSGTVMTEEISQIAETTEGQDIMLEAVNMVQSINFGAILWSFLFYFVFGYLLYAAMFAAIGGMVDNETDSNQFSTVVSLPLIVAIVCSTAMVNNPDSSLGLWLSMIPFTSPISMMIRIPFGVPYWQVAVSLILLILTFILITWLAGKIYRTGILMYGKKPSFKEIWKWLRY